MLASAPRLNSADRPMKTSVLRQRKGSIRKQHLLSWAWQQGRGQAMQSGGKNKNFPNNQNWNSSLSSPTLLFKSQTNQNYAGAKFSEPPSPSVLPKPPSHWVPVSFNPSDKEIMTFQLKTLLKVQV
ncbi:proline-rich nuclear receptor coactivator 2 [Delphinus delphis]|uniref:proline-rich nuclear receptor coactivator 2 n=1 Tax=Delphinus delphis TaxID=9728 RepID=UPI0037509716